jgi:hypothetical protein
MAQLMGTLLLGDATTEGARKTVRRLGAGVTLPEWDPEKTFTHAAIYMGKGQVFEYHDRKAVLWAAEGKKYLPFGRPENLHDDRLQAFIRQVMDSGSALGDPGSFQRFAGWKVIFRILGGRSLESGGLPRASYCMELVAYAYARSVEPLHDGLNKHLGCRELVEWARRHGCGVSGEYGTVGDFLDPVRSTREAGRG